MGAPPAIVVSSGRPFTRRATSTLPIFSMARWMSAVGLPILATIAGGAPMIGFLGTVTGMVKAFFNMSKAGNNIDITLLSDGIYTAMLTTVGGLVVGIIAYFGYNWLTSKVSDLVYKMESSTLEFIDIVLHEPGEE